MIARPSRVQRIMDWIATAMKAPVMRGPGTLLDTIQPTIDIFGTIKYAAYSGQFWTGGTGVTSNTFAAVPAGKIWTVLFGGAYHSNPTSQGIGFNVIIPGPLTVPLNFAALASNQVMALPNIILPPGTALQVTCPSLGAYVIVCNFLYLEQDVGEYTAPR